MYATATPSPDHAPGRSWYRQLGRRIAYLWPLKALGTMSFMALFFWAYFAILRAPFGTPTIMPRLVLDAWIPFTTAAFPVYAGLWVYVSLPPALLGSFRPLMRFTGGVAALCAFCLALFWLLPTAVPPAEIDWTQYPQLDFLKSMDAAGNACPSLHVATSVYAALWLAAIGRAVGAPTALRWANALFCLAILWSTVATRQHVVLDVLAGTVVGLLFAAAFLPRRGAPV